MNFNSGANSVGTMPPLKGCDNLVDCCLVSFRATLAKKCFASDRSIIICRQQIQLSFQC